MGTNASKIRVTPDADEKVVLRSAGDGPETQTTIETSVPLQVLDTAEWHTGEVAGGDVVAIFNVTDLNLSTNTYSLDLLADSVAAMDASPVVVASYPVTAEGVYEMLINMRGIRKLHPTAKYLAPRVTVGGTPDSPSITYSAWLARTQ